MTRDPLIELDQHVQRITLPIAARPARLRAISEELLAHLHAAYNQEPVRFTDRQAAVNACIEHLGRVTELQQQLQRAVPSWERLLFTLVHRKETDMSSRFPTAWIWILAILAFLVGPALIMPAMAQYGHAGTGPMVVWPMLLGIAICLAGVALVIYREKVQRFVPVWESLFVMSSRSRSVWLWVIAILAILIGPSLIMPAMALYNHEGYQPAVLWPTLLGSAITLTGVAIVAQLLRSRPGQAA